MLWGEWTERFPLEYEAHRRKNHEARIVQANRNSRRVRSTSGSDLSSEVKASFAERARERATTRQRLEQLRLAEGFTWAGGHVGGRMEYRRNALVYQGLVSDENPILKLFVTKTPRAHGLRTGETKAESSGTDSKLLALDCAYIETSKSMRGVFRVELDRTWPSWDALQAAIAACGVPQPNIAVAYQDQRGQVWRPHLLWLVAESVCFTEKASKRPQSAWKGALKGLTARLLPIGADPGGLANPHRHKNPLSPLWDRRILAVEPYVIAPDPRPGLASLAALRPYLPTTKEAAETLLQASSAQAATDLLAHHPDPAINAESNGVFRHLASFARERVGKHRDAGTGSRKEFDAELALEALALAPSGRRAQAAALARARTTAEWTWINFQARKSVPALTPIARKRRFADGARNAAKAKRVGTLDKIVTAIERLSLGHRKPTQAEIASVIGKDLRTVKRYWREASTMVDKGDISLAIDKKDAPRPQAGERPIHSPMFQAAVLCRSPSLRSTQTRAVVKTSFRTPYHDAFFPQWISPRSIRPIPERAELEWQCIRTANDVRPRSRGLLQRCPCCLCSWHDNCRDSRPRTTNRRDPRHVHARRDGPLESQRAHLEAYPARLTTTSSADDQKAH